MFHSAVVAGGSRLFFTIRPPLEEARQIVAASEWLGGKPLSAGMLHITLLILDDLLNVPPALIDALCSVGDAVSAAPFAITLDRLVVSGRWAALRPSAVNAPLQSLYDQLARLARCAGIAERADHRFNAHMTVSHHAARACNERVRPVSWTATELLLVRSHLGRTRHEPIGTWPLTGADPQLALI